MRFVDGVRQPRATLGLDDEALTDALQPDQLKAVSFVQHACRDAAETDGAETQVIDLDVERRNPARIHHRRRRLAIRRLGGRGRVPGRPGIQPQPVKARLDRAIPVERKWNFHMAGRMLGGKIYDPAIRAARKVEQHIRRRQTRSRQLADEQPPTRHDGAHAVGLDVFGPFHRQPLGEVEARDRTAEHQPRRLAREGPGDRQEHRLWAGTIHPRGDPQRLVPLQFAVHQPGVRKRGADHQVSRFVGGFAKWRRQVDREAFQLRTDFKLERRICAWHRELQAPCPVAFAARPGVQGNAQHARQAGRVDAPAPVDPHRAVVSHRDVGRDGRSGEGGGGATGGDARVVDADARVDRAQRFAEEAVGNHAIADLQLHLRPGLGQPRQRQVQLHIRRYLSRSHGGRLKASAEDALQEVRGQYQLAKRGQPAIGPALDDESPLLEIRDRDAGRSRPDIEQPRGAHVGPEALVLEAHGGVEARRARPAVIEGQLPVSNVELGLEQPVALAEGKFPGGAAQLETCLIDPPGTQGAVQPLDHPLGQPVHRQVTRGGRQPDVTRHGVDLQLR